MPKTEVRHPDKMISAGAYPAGILVDGRLYVSGHAGEDLRTGEVAPGVGEGLPLAIDATARVPQRGR